MKRGFDNGSRKIKNRAKARLKLPAKAVPTERSLLCDCSSAMKIKAINPGKKEAGQLALMDCLIVN